MKFKIIFVLFEILFSLTLAISLKSDEWSDNSIDSLMTVSVNTSTTPTPPTPTPIVFYHGMGDTSHGSIYSVQKHLEEIIPGVYVMSVRMGNNTAEDFMSSYFLDLNEQVDDACRQLTADTRLANGFNAIGFSQGGQILRAVLQRCPTIQIFNLISIGGQHQGVYGLPHCPQRNQICDLVRKLLNYGAYEEYIQQHLVQAQYWHDPIEEQLYKTKSVFLSDINNEITRNPKYKERILKLKNLVLVKFLNDSMVEPRESSHFGFYKEGQSQDVYNLKDSQLYNEDWIGLKELDSTQRLRLYSVIGDHLQIDIKWFDSEIVDKYLK